MSDVDARGARTGTGPGRSYRNPGPKDPLREHHSSPGVVPLGGAWCPSHPPVTSGAILGVAQQEAGRANLTLPLDDVDESALDGHVQDASHHAVQLLMKKMQMESLRLKTI